MHCQGRGRKARAAAAKLAAKALDALATIAQNRAFDALARGYADAACVIYQARASPVIDRKLHNATQNISV